MEENIAILIADLSGYTSLTDTHGAGVAADLIDKYLGIVDRSLVGAGTLHQHTGDEVLIVSPSPDDLLFTAFELIQNASAENEFLQLHGGLHYGNVLKRNNNYFGSAINLTSRIAGKASPGAIWCSEQFIRALPDRSATEFKDRGEHSFKNFAETTKIFELVIRQGETHYIDPVCRMLIRDLAKAVAHPHNKGLYFCSETCLNAYLSR
jgi:adenylate cyclase